MKKIYRVLSCLLFVLMLSHSNDLCAQDSTATIAPPSYSTFGFQVSLASGSGLTYGRVFLNGTRARVTAGIITTEDKTTYSYGVDYHFLLANTSSFIIYIGPSYGVYGSSKDAPKNRLALGTSLEAPVTGDKILHNLSLGATLYYPTYYFLSKTLNPTVGAYFVYNF